MKDIGTNKIDHTLFQRYAEGRCTDKEKALIDDWFIMQKRQALPFDLDENSLQTDLDEVKQHLDKHIAYSSTRRNRIIKWLSTAASLTLLGLSVYYFNAQESDKISSARHDTAQETKTRDSAPHSVRHAKSNAAPAQPGAVLVLANGERMHLGAQPHSSRKVDGGVTIDFSAPGELTYRNYADDPKSDQPATNTIIVPKGHVYSLILADGSKVSLNADSKLTFPIRSNDNRIDLYLEGEAYFEVSRITTTQSNKPRHREFVVHTGESSVRVLGTKFNIKAYPSDRDKSFVLESGSISLSTPNSPTPLLIEPGQKASLFDGSDLRLEDIDIQRELSWKNGDFYFKNNTLPEILEQLSRWYDVHIQYLGAIGKDRYISTISRRKTLKEVLEILESTTGVAFDIQQKGKERRIMVIP